MNSLQIIQIFISINLKILTGDAYETRSISKQSSCSDDGDALVHIFLESRGYRPVRSGILRILCRRHCRRVSREVCAVVRSRNPHKIFGTSANIITMIVILQIITIILTRGNIQLLGDAYAFGIVWSFAMQGLSVLVLRYRQPEEPEWKVPLNFRIAGREFPLGLGLITLALFALAIVNLFTNFHQSRHRCGESWKTCRAHRCARARL